jgi:hypothetical protein
MCYSSLLVIIKIYREYTPSAHDNQETTDFKNLETDNKDLQILRYRQQAMRSNELYQTATGNKKQ